MTAPYNPYHIKRMKEIAAAGGGVFNVAREFGWTPEFIKRVRDAHGIDLADGEGLQAVPEKRRPTEFINLTVTLPITLVSRLSQEAALLQVSPQRLAASVLACAYVAADDPLASGRRVADSSRPLPVPVASASPQETSQRK